jgi:GGDEF domain-containing protein
MSELELYRELYCDQLTKVQNRRAFEAAEFSAVAVVDMDSLKYLNDNLGHRVGDRYLTQLAQELVREFGRGNVFRIAGDEFAVIGENCEALREGMETAREHFRGFSFGVGCTLVQADSRLMREKRRRELQGVRASRGEPPPWLGKKSQKSLLKGVYFFGFRHYTSFNGRGGPRR